MPKFILNFHIWLYRLTRGVIGGNMPGNPILLLHSQGRKSGKQYVNPLSFFRDGERYVVVGSNWGKDHNAGWYYNLQAEPRTTIEVMGDTIPVTAHIAEDEEYKRLWSEITTAAERYAQYQQKTTRHIPLVVLTPVG